MYIFEENGILNITTEDERLHKVIKENIPSRKWNSSLKRWEIPICRGSIRALYPLLKDNDIVKKYVDIYTVDAKNKSSLSIQEIGIDFNNYGIIPYRYQQEGIKFILMSKRCIIADEPGLGKTLQGIIGAHLLAQEGMIVVVCPRALVYNWVFEINRVLRYVSADSIKTILNRAPIYVADGFSAKPIPDGKRWIVCGYSQFVPLEKVDETGKPIRTTWASYLSKCNVKTLILDEAHKVKNPKANRTKSLRALAHKVDNLILLSGTIMLNSVEELWSPLNMVSEYDFPKKKFFCDRYMRSYELTVKKRIGDRHIDLKIPKYYGTKNSDELKRIISPFIIRRLKSEVMNELPDKQRIFIPIELPAEYKREYEKMQDEFIDYLISKGELDKAIKASRAEQLVRGTELMKFVSNIKAIMAEDIILELVDTSKVVVFCQYKDTVDVIREYLGDIAVKATGDLNESARYSAIDAFKKNDNIRVLILTYGVGSEGLNLQESDQMLVVDFNWVPAIMLQAEDRIHRLTSTKNVTIRYMYLSETIDELIYKAIKDKISNIGKIFSMDNNIIEDFVKELKLLAQEDNSDGNKQNHNLNTT